MLGTERTSEGEKDLVDGESVGEREREREDEDEELCRAGLVRAVQV